MFGERSSVVLDPSEEKLKTEFENVERFYVSLHAVIRIDEVNKPGPARIHAATGESSKVTPFSMVRGPRTCNGWRAEKWLALSGGVTADDAVDDATAEDEPALLGRLPSGVVLLRHPLGLALLDHLSQYAARLGRFAIRLYFRHLDKLLPLLKSSL